MAEFAGNKDGSVAGKVNVNGWNLYGRDSEANDLRPLPGGFERQSDAVFLVGPIVGAVTETTGRQVFMRICFMCVCVCFVCVFECVVFFFV